MMIGKDNYNFRVSFYLLFYGILFETIKSNSYIISIITETQLKKYKKLNTINFIH